MHPSLREVLYVATLAGTLWIFQHAKRSFVLFSLLVLPGTLCHELCHLLVGSALKGRPTGFTLIPRREGQGYVLGSVTFGHLRWYNAFFIGTAPLLLLPAAYGILMWRLRGPLAFGWREALACYLIANLFYASLPSWEDLRTAARSPIGWLLLAGAAAYGWIRFQAARHAPATQSRISEQVS